MTERIMAMSLYHGFIVSSFRAQVEDCFFGLFSDSFSRGREVYTARTRQLAESGNDSSR